MKKLKVILIGAGNRGNIYTNIMSRYPDKFEVIGVAEPNDGKRNHIKARHNINDEMCFKDWREILNLGKVADVAVIATMDRDHFEPTMKAISLKYDILLEKPVSPNPLECLKISNAASENGVRVLVCHVLRYTDIFNSIKDIIDSGIIGDIISVNHEECVGNAHQSHSFVRGNWGNSERSSFMLLQKSCHDIDILQWLIGKKCKKVQSFGALTHFIRKNAPEGSPEYCAEGCPAGDTCPYNTDKLYFTDMEHRWFRDHLVGDIPNATDDDVRRVLAKTQYGKCVYKCDNDVVDHQTVNMLFEDDITVTFTMNAFNKGGRFIHIMGTKGELHAALAGVKDSYIKVFDFETRETKEYSINGGNSIAAGHGGGDAGIILSMYDYFANEVKSRCLSDIGVSCDNHITVFAAEYSRINGCIVDIDEFKKELMK